MKFKRQIAVKALITAILVISIQTVNAQWVQTNGSYGGRGIDLFMTSFHNYNRTFSSGVFLPVKESENWTAGDSNIMQLYVYSLAVSGNSIFAGTSSGVFLSTNNGSRWTSLDLNDHIIMSLVVSDSNIFAGTYGGVFLRPLSDFNETTRNGCGCGSGVSLALLPPIWFMARSCLKRKKGSK